MPITASLGRLRQEDQNIVRSFVKKKKKELNS
jgi:hypothetical protein